MPSLQLSSFAQALTAGDQIDYVEIRLGEAYALPFKIADSAGNPINLTNWTLAVTAESYTANFAYGGNGDLIAVSDFTDQTMGGSQPQPGLAAEITNAALGEGVVSIPSNLLPPNPASIISADGDNTLLNIVTITATYPSGYSFSGTPFDNVRKLLIGLVVRFGG